MFRQCRNRVAKCYNLRVWNYRSVLFSCDHIYFPKVSVIAKPVPCERKDAVQGALKLYQINLAFLKVRSLVFLVNVFFFCFCSYFLSSNGCWYGLTVGENDQIYEILGWLLIDSIACEMYGASQERQIG